MMNGIRQWIAGVIALSFAMSLGEKLIAGAGIKRIWNMVGGILLTIAIFSPLLELTDAQWELSLWEAAEQTSLLEQSLRESGEEQLASGIEEALETYIWDKAKALGLSGEIEVSVSGKEGGYLPQTIVLKMPFHQQLSEVISKELGLGRDRQLWQEA